MKKESTMHDVPTATSNIGPEWTPDWTSPPGDTILDALEELNMTVSDLATRMGIPRDDVVRLVSGQAVINAETAAQLESALGEPAEFWLTREAQYRSVRP